jgi:hypothetical protein
MPDYSSVQVMVVDQPQLSAVNTQVIRPQDEVPRLLMVDVVDSLNQQTVLNRIKRDQVAGPDVFK